MEGDEQFRYKLNGGNVQKVKMGSIEEEKLRVKIEKTAWEFRDLPSPDGKNGEDFYGRIAEILNDDQFAKLKTIVAIMDRKR